MQSIEAWLPVVGYEGIYEVSDRGQVRSLDRHVLYDSPTPRHQITRGRPIRPHPHHRSGHLQVSIYKDSKRRVRFVHQLVLEAFAGPCPGGMEACHWNGDESDNRLENLRWDTHLSNEADKTRHGTHGNTVKTHCPNGHPLSKPNLVPGKLDQGSRVCLACKRESSSAWNTGREFSVAAADERFADIIAGRSAVKTHCPRGHRLAHPNLIPSQLKRGSRGCLACNRASGTATGKRHGINVAVADEKYREIMEAVS